MVIHVEQEIDQTIQHLLQSPRLPLVVKQFEAILKTERENRQRFYAEMSEDQKVEFINGEVIVQTPARWSHTRASDSLFALFSAYVRKHDLGHVGHEKLLITLTRNDYEPDISFWGKEKARAFSNDQVKFPAPDLVVEVLSPSTEAYDGGIKFEEYALHGVIEYWLIHPDEEFVEQYVLTGDRYELLFKSRNGSIQSNRWVRYIGASHLRPHRTPDRVTVDARLICPLKLDLERKTCERAVLQNFPAKPPQFSILHSLFSNLSSAENIPEDIVAYARYAARFFAAFVEPGGRGQAVGQAREG
jgi:Uma2 family endonuclease